MARSSTCFCFSYESSMWEFQLFCVQEKKEGGGGGGGGEKVKHLQAC